MRLGIIDLGTNSIRFDLHQIDKGGKVRRLHREKVMVRLGQGVFVTGKLDPRASLRTLEALRSIARTAEELHVDRIAAFGTSALRESSDAAVFLKRVEKETGIRIRVISGQEEAQLIAEGVLGNEKLPKGAFALVDIGGGSMEAILCQGKQVLRARSFGLGVARLQQLFLKSSPPMRKARGSDPVENLREHVRRLILPVFKSEKWPRARTAIGSSGTAQALLRINKKYFGKSRALSLKDLRKLVRKMSGLTTTELLAMPGMEPKRVDLILAGAIVMEECLSALGATRLLATEFSLREGILREEVRKLTKVGSGGRLRLAREAAVLKAARLGVPKEHTDLVVRLVERLFDRLKSLHGLPSEWKEFLVIAAILHDSGESVSAREHGEHSAYIVRNADLPGIEADDLEVVAQLCRLHQGKRVTPRDVPFGRNAKRYRSFLKVLALLRIADAMDRGHRGALLFHDARILKDRVSIRVSAKGNADLELLRVDSKKELFEEVFGRELVLEPERRRKPR